MKRNKQITILALLILLIASSGLQHALVLSLSSGILQTTSQGLKLTFRSFDDEARLLGEEIRSKLANNTFKPIEYEK